MSSVELARCIGPARADRASWLADRTWPRVIAGADPAHWGDLFGLDLLDDLLHGTALRRPYFHVTKDGRRAPLSRITRDVRVLGAAVTGVPHAEHVYAELAGGASLVLLQLEDLLPTVRRFCAAVSAELDRAVDCGAYVTPPAVAGLPLHMDAQDVVLLQVSGSKTWSVHEEVDDGRPASRRIRADERPERLLQVTLRPGDALVIPGGHPHTAVSGSTVSCHLTVGITRPTRRDALSRRVTAAVAELDALDAVLDDRPEAADAEVRADLRQLAEALGSGAARDLVPSVRSPLTAPTRLGDLHRLLSGAPVAWAGVPGTRPDPLPPGLPALVAALADGRPFRLRDVAADGVPAAWVPALAVLTLTGRLAPA